MAPEAARVRPGQEVSARLPDARGPADRVARPVARPLELSALRVARLRGGRGEPARIDGLRAAVHGRGVAALGRLPVRRPDEGPRRTGALAVRGLDAHGRGGRLV